MTEVRTLKPEELEKLGRLYRNAYRIDAATAARWLASIEPSHTYVIADADRVMSAIQILPYRVVIGGSSLPMGGIGGVATWADRQGLGYAGQLMAASVPCMRELGHAVSILYPFSYRYYGRFGWALGARRALYTDIRPQDLPRRKQPPRVRAALTDADFQAAARGYEFGYDQFNCLVERGEKEWAQQRRKCGEERYHVYIIENEDAEVRGYFSCEDVPLSPHSYETVVRDLICADADAYREVFAFLALLPTNVAKVTIAHAEKPPLWRYFQEPAVETRLSAYFQIRVVDAVKACGMRGYRHDVSAQLTFALHDPHGPWNEGIWDLHVRDGRGHLEPSNRPPQLELTIQQFSALFAGFADPYDLAWHGEIAPRDEAVLQTLRRMFCDRPTNLLDFF